MEDVKIQILDKLDLLEELLFEGSRLPFSSSRLVDENETTEVIDEIRELIPKELTQGAKILSSAENYITQAKIKSKHIINEAIKHREELFDKNSIQQEANKRVNEIEEKTKEHCQKMLKEAQLKSISLQKEYEESKIKLDLQINQYKNKLEEESENIKSQLEIEYNQHKRSLSDKHQRNMLEAMNELDNINAEINKLKIETQKDQVSIHNESLKIKQETKVYCELLLSQARNEAKLIQDGANKYTEDSLRDLAVKLQHMSSTVAKGMEEVSKIKNISTSPSRNKPTHYTPLSPIEKAKNKMQTIGNRIKSIH